MKYLILLALLSACASTPDPKPVYDSVYGDWKFSNKDVSGSFTIDNDMVTGTFTVLGKTLVADERKILFRGGLAFNIELISSNKGFVVLELCEPSTKYDTLLSAQYNFGTTSENRVITKTFITR